MRARHVPREMFRFVRRALGFRRPPPDSLARITSDLQPGDVFVDVGANVGVYSRAAAQIIGTTGAVVAIEPNPAILAQLEAALVDFQSARIVPVAVGEHPHSAELHVFRQHTRSSLLQDGRVKRYTLDERNRLDPVTVRVEPLLSILITQGIQKVDALKIDVEGYEDRVLIPFLESAPKNMFPKRILIELSRDIWNVDCIAYMESHDYKIVWKGKGDALLER